MSGPKDFQDAVVIGGGFYGAAIAIYLAKSRGFKNVTLIERDRGLLQRASYNNQARVHNGYHYPRSFTTAYRSRINFPRFVKDWPSVVKADFTKLYAIARRNSKVTSKQFERFCREIGAEIKVASAPAKSLFEKKLIEEVYEVQEYAFDSTKLASWAAEELKSLGVSVRTQTKCIAVSQLANGGLVTEIMSADRGAELIKTRYVFNCTYSGLNQLKGDFPGSKLALKHEITEMPLLQVPNCLERIGITVMDGPFFSLMPFPARQLHTLSHVRYTPHMHWPDETGVDPYLKLSDYRRDSRVDWMIRDVQRYLPCISSAVHVDSLYEIKTVLTKNESDDGRPILFEKHTGLPGCFSVLGGKIDNIYDVIEKLDAEPLFVHGDCKGAGV
ncbi:FAD-dependent oxidoreductase [Pseudomonas japonica]|uniref:FAD-dependent oxidoreductase n=1 Tax=Pseudomonas japonica TaxID=256466 RepID=UPI0015E2AC02|nr:FAD-dependent oxidoreductase [Pseudomonas japonica]MBA1288774.1 FAD-dependent oxidoreductase [Pseudomonas japonica]